MEKWLPVVGYEAHYEVSDAGRVRSLDRILQYKDGRSGRYKGSLIAGTVDANGYVVVTLTNKARRHVHRLVAEAFLGLRETRTTVNHKNGKKADNRLSNLEWATYTENNRHARATGLQRQHGENCNLTKFSSHTARALKKVHERFGLNHKELAEIFGISTYHVGEILRGESRVRG